MGEIWKSALPIFCASIALLWAPTILAAPKTHDGFYLRLALGLGGLGMSRDVDARIGGTAFSTGESSVGGFTLHNEVTVGGTPTDGLVLGGSILSYIVGSSEIKAADGSTRELDSALRFVVIGPSVDWFPVADAGFHLGGTFGIAGAWAKLPEEEPFENVGGAGGALSLLVGYDWWVAREWSLGALVRLTGAGIKGEDRQAGVTARETSSVGSLTIGFGGLYH